MRKSNRPALPVRILTMALLAVAIQIPPIFELIVKGQLAKNFSLAMWCLVLELASFAVIIWVASYLFKKYRRWTPSNQNVRKRLAWLFGGYIVLVLGQGSLVFLNQLLYHQNQTTNNQALASLMGNSKLMMVLVAGSAIFLSPVAEELIFRGVLMNLFFKNDAFWAPILLSGLVFTLEHASTTPISYLIYFYMGAVFAFVYRKTGSLGNAIALHTLNNLVATAALLLSL